MAMWRIEKIKEAKIKNPILIAGLPGIANVGKITVDFVVEKKKGEKIYEFSSNRFPHTVFVNEENLVQLPKISLYHIKNTKQELLVLAGDVQPIDEESCYEFCEMLLDLYKTMGGKELITLGGIGLNEIPTDPKLYITGTNQKIVAKYKKKEELKEKIYGVVGPIIGVSGLLIGLAPKKGLEGATLLAETYGHPMYVGVKGARKILKYLDKRFELKLDLKELDKQIEQIEKAMKQTEELGEVSKDSSLKRMGRHETSYIG